ncbi:MAG: hypothetical protein KBD15_03545 [Candidatus Magasanikbacteria bacterium]|nr:hypothetical protein [Candidatus Magasanikbacteria bacterium]
MFGKKEAADAVSLPYTLPTVSVTTIPTAFYGGKDPEIYPEVKDVSHGAASSVSPKKNIQELPPEPVVPRVEQIGTPPVSHHQTIEKPTDSAPQKKSGSKKMMVLFVCVLILVVAGISWYYLRPFFASKPERSVDVPPLSNTQNIPPPQENIPPPPVVATSTIIEEPILPSLSTSTVILFPSARISLAPDSDGDELTDMEEEVFRTDVSTWDSDSDGYHDGREVFNLYNPTGIAPEKIIDSGLVREYVNPVWQYRVYYPTSWQVDAVDPNGDQVLFSSISGEYIEVRSLSKKTNESFDMWFAEHARGEQYTDLVSRTNRFQIPTRYRSDGLVGYVESADAIFVLLYRTGIQETFVRFPHVHTLLLQSFRPYRTLTDIPKQVVLPPSGNTATSSLNINILSPASSTTPVVISSSTSSTLNPI